MHILTLTWDLLLWYCTYREVIYHRIHKLLIWIVLRNYREDGMHRWWYIWKQPLVCLKCKLASNKDGRHHFRNLASNHSAALSIKIPSLNFWPQRLPFMLQHGDHCYPAFLLPLALHILQHLMTLPILKLLRLLVKINNCLRMTQV